MFYFMVLGTRLLPFLLHSCKIVSNNICTTLFAQFPTQLLFRLIADDEEERNLRRVSYLRATKEDRMQLDSDLEQEIIAANQEHVSAANTPKQR